MGKPTRWREHPGMDHEFFLGESMAANEAGWDWLSVANLKTGPKSCCTGCDKKGWQHPIRTPSGQLRGCKREVSSFCQPRNFAMNADGRGYLDQSGDQGDVIRWRWHVSIPRLKMELDVTTPLRSQELASSIRKPATGKEPSTPPASRDRSRLRGAGYLRCMNWLRGKRGGPVIPR